MQEGYKGRKRDWLLIDKVRGYAVRKQGFVTRAELGERRLRPGSGGHVRGGFCSGYRIYVYA
jgi:hypothetical protein